MPFSPVATLTTDGVMPGTAIVFDTVPAERKIGGFSAGVAVVEIEQEFQWHALMFTGQLILDRQFLL